MPPIVSLFKSISFVPFLVSSILTFITIPTVIRLANYFGLVTDPSKDKHPGIVHSGIIPRAGGLATFLGIVIPLMIFLPLSKLLVGLILGMAVILFEGLLDDK